MKSVRTLSAAILLGSAAHLLAAPAALASPEIASGDGIVNADVDSCIAQTDAFVSTLDVQVEQGQIDRTGYFGDGSFRILCYPNPYGQSSQSLVVVFAAHESDFEIADTFVQIALEEIADR
ncbi:MAG: hypothetical protein AAF810_16440 [Cyanobacteria bacterium P01_D01_bin.36]